MEAKDTPIMYVSHLMKPDASPLFSVVQQKHYHELYAATGKNPHDDSLWDTIVQMAEKEEKQGISTYLPTVPLDEMIAEGRLLQHDTTQEARYHHLFERCSNGLLWYDIIHDENTELLRPALPFLESLVQRRGRKVGRALDIGTGTGNAVRDIAPYCSSVVGIDVLPEAIDIAKGRTDIATKATFEVGDATDLHFPSESMDLVLSNGVTVYLTKDQEWKQNEEIDRVLKSGGVYLMVNGVPRDIESEQIEGAKNLLQNLISWMIVSSAVPPSEQMRIREAREQFETKGYRGYRSPAKEPNNVIGLMKPYR